MARNDEQFVRTITDILVRQKAISPGEGASLANDFDRSSQVQFDFFLIDEGLVDEAALLAALAEYYQVPSFNAVGYLFSCFLLRKFPKSFLLRNKVVPLTVDENMLVVVAAHPSDPELLPKLGEHVSYDIRFNVGIARDIIGAIEEFYDISPTEITDVGI